MNISKQIESLLVDEKLDALLTASALKKISEMAESVSKLEADLEAKTGKIEAQRIEANKRSGQFDVLHAEVVSLREGVADVELREKKITILECAAKHESQRVEDHQTMFKLVFRNVEVRKQVLENGTLPVPDPNGYHSMQPTLNDKTEETSQE